MGTRDAQDAADSAAAWDRSSPHPWSAATAPHVYDSPHSLDSVTRRSSDARHHTACQCIAYPANASHRYSLHSPHAHGSSKLTVATRPGHTAAQDSSADARAQSAPAWHHVASPAFFFQPVQLHLELPDLLV